MAIEIQFNCASRHPILQTAPDLIAIEGQLPQVKAAVQGRSTLTLLVRSDLAYYNLLVLESIP